MTTRFALMGVVLAVAASACQGPTGPAGTNGNPGATGATGPAGDPGAPARPPLLFGPDKPAPRNGFAVSRFKHVLTGAVLTFALIAVPAVPVLAWQSATPAASTTASAATTSMLCAGCW